MKRLLTSMTAVLTLTAAFSVVPSTAFAEQNVQTEQRNHPNIDAAIRELQDALNRMNAAPNDFNGHKGNAMNLTQQAIQELKNGLWYRARVDNHEDVDGDGR